MENAKRRKLTANRGMEENTMAILDGYGSRDSSHNHADRIAFLDAVRSASVLPEDGPPPTSKMLEAIFGIFRDATSLELMMTNYQLLTELEKKFPQVHQNETNPSDLITMEEAWSPFALAIDFPSSEKRTTKGKSSGPFSVLDFHILLEDLADLAGEKGETTEFDLFGNMLAFQYLVFVLEGDFWPRNSVFLGTSNWISLKESTLNLLLGSRQIKYKDIVKNCLSIISTSFPSSESNIFIVGEGESVANEALRFALPQVGKSTQKAAKKLLTLMLELDSSRKIADMKGLMTRGDGVRNSTMETIVEELTYEKVCIASFLQAFDEPKLKLEIFLQYFQKYSAKPCLRTRRSSNDSINDATVSGVLKGFANTSITKNIIKKIGAEETQILLAHALQACMALSNQELLEVVFDSKTEVPSSPLREISNNIASAFKSLRSINKSMEIIPLGKEALFAAATILAA